MEIKCLYDELISISDLKPHPKNRNIHPKHQIYRLAKILTYQGIRSPIVVSKRSGLIVKGHGTLAAIKENKWKQAPIVRQDFESDEQEYAFVQSDNAIANWSELDLSAINADIGDLGPDFDIDLLGIKDFSIEPSEKFVPQCDEDEIPEKVELKTKTGDIYQLGRHKLMCGDSTVITNIESILNGEIADLWLTDPPYGVDYQSKNAAVHGGKVKNQKNQDGIASDEKKPSELRELWRIVSSNAFSFTSNEAAMYWFGASSAMMMMMMISLDESGWNNRHTLIWVKSSLVFGRSDYHYRHEPILYGWKKNGTHHWYSDRKQDSVLEYDRPHRSNMHPTMKPVDMLEYLMTNSTKKGQLVLDTFGGSGSTLIAAEKSGRFSRVIEISPLYCDVIISRWEKYTGNKAELLNG